MRLVFYFPVPLGMAGYPLYMKEEGTSVDPAGGGGPVLIRGGNMC